MAGRFGAAHMGQEYEFSILPNVIFASWFQLIRFFLDELKPNIFDELSDYINI